MMSPAHVLEPTYDAIRRRLLAGAWEPGARLEAARLADDAVARRRKDLDAAVELVGGAGEQRVHWRVETKRGG